MWHMFKEAHERDSVLNECSYEQYRYVCSSFYNLGFGTPRNDVCSTCEEMRQSLKYPTDADAKIRLALELLIHKRKAQKFYGLLNEEVDASTVTFAVDMMQNQPLPKIPIGETFYSRQLWQYLLGIVRHFGKNSQQRKHDCFLYTWTEHQSGKGSDEISSALVDFFTRFMRDN